MSHVQATTRQNNYLSESKPIGEFCEFQTKYNADKITFDDVVLHKPKLINAPFFLKLETNRAAYIEQARARKTQEAMVHRDVLVAELAKPQRDDERVEKHLNALVALKKEGLNLAQVHWEVEPDASWARSTTEKSYARKVRLDLAENSHNGVRRLIADLQRDKTFRRKEGALEILDLLADGLSTTLANNAPANRGPMANALTVVPQNPPQGQAGNATRAQPRPQNPPQGQGGNATRAQPQPQQAEDPQVTEQKLRKNKLLRGAAVTVAAYERDSRTVQAADYKFAKALLEQEKADREYAEFMKNQQASATGATRTTTTTATTATTTTTSTTVPTNAHRRDPSTANANPSPAQDNKSYQAQVRDLDDDQV